MSSISHGQPVNADPMSGRAVVVLIPRDEETDDGDTVTPGDTLPSSVSATWGRGGGGGGGKERVLIVQIGFVVLG